MDITELERLADWYTDHHKYLIELYNQLLSPLQHNASQPSKVPVEIHLESLVDYLNLMGFEELSIQQIKVLSDMDVGQLIGRDGAAYIESVIRTSEFDAATAVVRVSEAISALIDANSGFSEYQSALGSLGLQVVGFEEEHDAITIRVGFQNDASIENLSDWKDSAKDWYEIIRGLSMAANEAPEDTKVIGASTGSIILILAGTLTVTTLLALISKNIASVAKESIGIQNQVEDLRHKKWLNSTIEREFKKKEEAIKNSALTQIVKLIKVRIPDLDGEKITAIEGSIKKLLAFNEKGGNVDFVTPESVEGGDIADGNEKDDLDAIREVQTMIREYQATREELKLLVHQTDDSK